MTWVFLALLTHLFWGLTNIGEKYLVDKEFKNPFVYVFLGFVAGLVGLLIVPFVDFFIPSIHILFWIFIASVGFCSGVLFYIKAVQIEEISRINMLWSFLPLFTLLGSHLFIDERLSVIEFSAFTFLVLGGFVASLHAKSGKFKLSLAFLYMLVACVFFAAYDIVLRYITDGLGTSFEIVFIFSTIFFVLIGLLFFISNQFRTDFFEEKKNFFTWKVIGIILVINILSKIGLLFNMWSISLAPVSLVNAMEGTQAIFVFLITIFLTLSFPHIIKEEIDRRNIFLKVVAICFVVVGLVILGFAG
ncbi:MAG: EamA family transporter [Candidatus Magasanikbacteria bacterium]|nr:EamA family transporter [Candidatus Magasanikbacteria bacterium]